MTSGYVHRDFLAVADWLQRLTDVPGGGGAAVCVYHRSECARVADWMMSEEKPKSVWRSVPPRILDGAWRMIGIDRNDLKDALLPHGARELYRSKRLLDAEVPALNGFFTARSLARMYAMLGEGGELDGTRLVRMARLGAIAVRSAEQLARRGVAGGFSAERGSQL